LASEIKCRKIANWENFILTNAGLEPMTWATLNTALNQHAIRQSDESQKKLV
jgi:hypothetical protein